jgi:hypothetical protein
LLPFIIGANFFKRIRNCNVGEVGELLGFLAPFIKGIQVGVEGDVSAFEGLSRYFAIAQYDKRGEATLNCKKFVALIYMYYYLNTKA